MLKGLLIKDIFLMKKYWIILIFIAFLGFVYGTDGALLASVITISFASTTIYDDETSKWDLYALMLPYKKSSLVLSKYLISYFNVTAIFLTLFIFSFTSLKFSPITLGFDFRAFLFVFVTVLGILAFELPFAIIFGSQKGRFVNLIVVAVAVVTLNLLVDVFETAAIKLEDLIVATDIMLIVAAVFAVIANVISIMITIAVKNKPKK